MSNNARSLAGEPQRRLRLLVGFLGLAAFALFASTACEDKGIGRPCDITESTTALQGAYNSNATDCPSRLCVKPAVQAGISSELDTASYCSAECASDDDCNGQTRDPANKNDKRCRKGFTCAPAFGQGPLCCKKICLCRDFYSASVGPALPNACNPDAGASCS
jgi:hypothetical protein